MIVEWFVKFITGIIDLLLSWLPAGDALALPDLGPLFGVFRSIDAVVPVQPWFDAVVVLLTVNGLLFAFALIRQLWRFVPIIGGG